MDDLHDTVSPAATREQAITKASSGRAIILRPRPRRCLLCCMPNSHTCRRHRHSLVCGQHELTRLSLVSCGSPAPGPRPSEYPTSPNPQFPAHIVAVFQHRRIRPVMPAARTAPKKSGTAAPAGAARPKNGSNGTKAPTRASPINNFLGKLFLPDPGCRIPWLTSAGVLRVMSISIASHHISSCQSLWLRLTAFDRSAPAARPRTASRRISFRFIAQ